MTQKVLDIKINSMIDILNMLKTYKPIYMGHKEIDQLRYYATIISEDIHFITEDYIRNGYIFSQSNNSNNGQSNNGKE